MNKLGFYLQNSSDTEGLFEAVRSVRPPVVLVHTDLLNKDLLTFMRKSWSPDTFVIGRLILDPSAPSNTKGLRAEQEKNLIDVDTEEEAAANGRWFADQILKHPDQLATKNVNGRRMVDAWMSLNEISPGPGSHHFRHASDEERNDIRRILRNYDSFQDGFRQRLQEGAGSEVEAVAFNFAAGNFSEAQHYLDFFPKTLASYRTLGFHEYGWHHLNPNHRDEKHGAASSGAGLYRTCMEGIRHVHGNKHSVVITELGLTREYKFPNDPREPEDGQLGDLGWLNHKETLSQDELWSSLRWYNDLIVNDAFVKGACLYQVGVTARFHSHRHLGKDNGGNNLKLINRIAELNSSVTEMASESKPKTGKRGKKKKEPSIAVELAEAASNAIECGVNIDPANRAHGNPSAQTVRELGVNWVRLVFKNPPNRELAASLAEYDATINDMNQQGVNVLMILNNESCPGKPEQSELDDTGKWQTFTDKFADRCRDVARHFAGRVAAYQIWNEPDHPGHPGYEPTVRERVYGQMLRTCTNTIKEVAPGVTVITAGMQSGDAGWVRRAIAATGNVLHADALAIHPYGQRPEPDWPPPSFDGNGVLQPWGFGEMVNLLRNYREVTAKPIWITELGTNDLNVQEQFPERSLNTLNRKMASVVQRVFWFCWSDGMVEPFGVVARDGGHKPSYAKLQGVARVGVGPEMAAAVEAAAAPEAAGPMTAKEAKIEVFDKDGNRKDFAWLKENYKVEFKDAGAGEKFKLVRVDETDGPAVFIADVRNQQGQPQSNQPVAFSWAQVAELDNAVNLTNSGVKSLWLSHALVQNTGNNGDTGFGFGGGSVIKENGGPHTFWVLSTSLKSDALARVGWLGSTNHRGPNRMTFRIVNEIEDVDQPEQPDIDNPAKPETDVMQKLEAIQADLKRLLKHFGLQ